MNGAPDDPAVSWPLWSVVLVKTDCLQRGLVDQVLNRVRAELCLVAVEEVTVTDWQIFTHYWDLFVHQHHLGVDVAECLRRRWVGQRAVIALGHGHAMPGDPDVPERIRALLGHFDPSHAAPGTIRGDFGTDSLAAARREHRLVDNLIHSSDDATAAWRDFHIWFGGHRAVELLTGPRDPAACTHTSTHPAAAPSADHTTGTTAVIPVAFLPTRPTEVSDS